MKTHITPTRNVIVVGILTKAESCASNPARVGHRLPRPRRQPPPTARRGALDRDTGLMPPSLTGMDDSSLLRVTEAKIGYQRDHVYRTRHRRSHSCHSAHHLSCAARLTPERPLEAATVARTASSKPIASKGISERMRWSVTITTTLRPSASGRVTAGGLVGHQSIHSDDSPG
jgi:hypothetical protein